MRGTWSAGPHYKFFLGGPPAIPCGIHPHIPKPLPCAQRVASNRRNAKARRFHPCAGHAEQPRWRTDLESGVGRSVGKPYGHTPACLSLHVNAELYPTFCDGDHCGTPQFRRMQQTSSCESAAGQTAIAGAVEGRHG